MFQLRQNPLNACQLQQSIDGGVNWSLAFDYSLCDGPLMTNPPYPDSPDGASDAAAQAMTNVYLGLLNLLDCETQSKAEYIALATNYMRTFDAGYAAPGPLGDLYDAFCALDPTEQAEALTDCPYTIMKGELTTCYDAGGLIDDLNCLSDNLINWLNEASDELMIALNTAAGLLSGSGWQAASGGAESGSGAGFGSGCGWTEEFDFSFGQLGWQPAFNAASYVAGVGWADNYPAQGTDGIRISTINTEIFRCLGVEVYLDPALGGTNPECFARNVAGNITIGEADGGGAFYGFVNNILVGGVFVGADPYVGSQQNTTAIITKIVVHGIGFNPWSE